MHSAAAVQSDVGKQPAALDRSLTEGQELKGTRRVAAHVTQDVSSQKPNLWT